MQTCDKHFQNANFSVNILKNGVVSKIKKKRTMLINCAVKIIPCFCLHDSYYENNKAHSVYQKFTRSHRFMHSIPIKLAESTDCLDF